MGRISISPISDWPSVLISLKPDEIGFHKRACCPACGEPRQMSEALRLADRTDSNEVRLTVCGACAHVFYDRVPEPDWFDRYYASHWDVQHRSDPRSRIERVTGADVLQPLLDLNLPPDARILDFGCGFANDLRGMKALGFTHVYGVEMSEHRVEHARRLIGTAVRLGSVDAARQIAEESGGFDLIYSNHVVEHIAEPLPIVEGLVKLLRPGGTILIRVPDVFLESPVATALFLPHQHLFNRYSMARLFGTAGLRSFAWSSMREDLVVAGTTREALTPAYEAVTDMARPDAKAIDSLVDYLRAPWSFRGQGPRFLSYWHPNGRQHLAAGFSHLSGFAAMALRVLAWPIARLQPERRPGAIAKVARVVRRVAGRQSLPADRLMSVRADETAGPPTLTARPGGLPVLLK